MTGMADVNVEPGKLLGRALVGDMVPGWAITPAQVTILSTDSTGLNISLKAAWISRELGIYPKDKVSPMFKWNVTYYRISSSCMPSKETFNLVLTTVRYVCKIGEILSQLK